MFGTIYGDMISNMAKYMDGNYDTKSKNKLEYTKERNEVKQDAIRRERQPRNEKCNCGSGKKFKKCCGKVVNKDDDVVKED